MTLFSYHCISCKQRKLKYGSCFFILIVLLTLAYFLRYYLLGVFYFAVLFFCGLGNDLTRFLETENIVLVQANGHGIEKTQSIKQEEIKNFLDHNCDFSNASLNSMYPNDITLTQSQNVIVLFGVYPPRNSKVKKKEIQGNDSYYYEFYSVEKKEDEVKTKYLGAIYTNYYSWKPHRNKYSISPDKKYIAMRTWAANSKDLEPFRNKQVTLVWQIGEDVVERDIVDAQGRKIPIVIKTHEELEKEVLERQREEEEQPLAMGSPMEQSRILIEHRLSEG